MPARAFIYYGASSIPLPACRSASRILLIATSYRQLSAALQLPLTAHSHCCHCRQRRQRRHSAADPACAAPAGGGTAHTGNKQRTTTSAEQNRTNKPNKTPAGRHRRPARRIIRQRFPLTAALTASGSASATSTLAVLALYHFPFPFPSPPRRFLRRYPHQRLR